MGGAVSSGRDNDELIDNLIAGNYIRSYAVERVFRALDRGDYMTEEAREQAYKDLAWKNGLLHMSAPCIYSEVMEGLELKPGLSFLNVGSGTGYLSTLVGLIIGSGGVNHGVEIYKSVIDYANRKLNEFTENSPVLDEFDFCEPKFFQVNGLNLDSQHAQYDRVYCGAGCPTDSQNYFKFILKVGGVLVIPLNDSLMQIRRTSAQHWQVKTLLSVSFATLRLPTKEETAEQVRLDEITPARLQALCRAALRSRLRLALVARRPELKERAPPRPPAKKRCYRNIRLPVDDDSDNAHLNALHGLDRESGGNEMNALLNLVLSMGGHRGAGSLRADPDSEPDTPDSEPDSAPDSPDTPEDEDDRPLAEIGQPRPRRSNRPRVSRILTFEIRDNSRDNSRDTSPETPPTDSKTDTATTSKCETGESSSTAEGDSETVGKTEDDMEWDKSRDTDAEDADVEDIDEDEDSGSDGVALQRRVRDKLDSGIGGDGSDGSPNGSDAGGVRGASDTTTTTDDAEDDQRTSRRKKRNRCRASSRSPSPGGGRRRGDGDEDEDGGDGDGDRGESPRDCTVRRLDLAINMKRAVNQLPLPAQLKVYVNLGRGFE